jgi:hypothetical protein
MFRAIHMRLKLGSTKVLAASSKWGSTFLFTPHTSLPTFFTHELQLVSSTQNIIIYAAKRPRPRICCNSPLSASNEKVMNDGSMRLAYQLPRILIKQLDSGFHRESRSSNTSCKHKSAPYVRFKGDREVHSTGDTTLVWSWKK